MAVRTWLTTGAAAYFCSSGDNDGGASSLQGQAEHAVDLETGAVIAVTLQPATAGDTKTVCETLTQCGEHVREVAAEIKGKAERLNPECPAELVLDKGYHSNDVLVILKEVGVRSYCSEPDRGRRNWKGKKEEQSAVYRNRRRIRGERGKRLLRQRGERVERSFAHMYETGNMRRTHLRKHDNIIKRLLIHAGAFNPGLVMRKMTGCGTPRGLQGCLSGLIFLFQILLRMITGAISTKMCTPGSQPVTLRKNVTPSRLADLRPNFGAPIFQN